MNPKLKELWKEKEAVSRDNSSPLLRDKELFSIARTIKSVYAKIDFPTDADKSAYDWAVSEIRWAENLS